MNINSIIYFVNKFSNNIICFFLLFFLINIEISLGLFSIFENSAPSLLSIAIYLCLKKFSINLSSFSLFFLGLLYDVLLGSNIGISSMFFLLIKYFTEQLKLNFSIINDTNDSNDDWFYFTFVYIVSFIIIFSLNIIVNLTIPDLSPILFHLGATLIIFPFLVISINFIYFITKLIKN